MLPLKALKEGPPWLFQLTVASGTPWLVATLLQSPPLSLHDLLLFVVSSLLSLILVIGFRAHMGNPGRSQVKNP